MMIWVIKYSSIYFNIIIDILWSKFKNIDESALENFHASQTFLLFNNPNLDITSNFTKE